MKKLLIFCLLMPVMLGTVSCGDDAVNMVIKIIRSADWLHKSVEWSSGKDALVTEELRNGNPEHNLSPAELIYFCARENKINPVLLLALIENQDLLSQGEGYGDFELRLSDACNYDTGSGKYGGFFVQLVASSFQFWLDQSKGQSFRESYERNFAKRFTLDEFMVIYARIVGEINQQFGMNYNTSPDPNTTDVFDDCQDLSIDQIQSYLDSCPATALKRKHLFKEVPLTNSIPYN
jgi:hypothetical protein